MTRVLFVCLGNICRSPTAEGIFIHLVQERGLASQYTIDSAGTGGWHVGAGADPRSQQEAQRHGVDLPSRARQFQGQDFQSFDHIIAMDRTNLHDLRKLCPDPELLERSQLLRDFDPENPSRDPLDVPDPYYGKEDGFANVYGICLRSCTALLDALEQPRA